MFFNGVSLKFSTENEKQYKEIGALWDYAEKLYGRENLLGLGYNWNHNMIEYVMAVKEGDIDLDAFVKVYPQAKKKKVLLPNEGWQTYRGKTENISSIYADIYKDGTICYEIECFTDEGNCEIQITRQSPALVCLKMEQLDEIMLLYKDAMTREFCVWNEEYPVRSDIQTDIERNNLFGILADDGSVVAVVAKDCDEMIDGLPCWSQTLHPAAELARLVIAREYENQGLARVLIKGAAQILLQRDFMGVHYLVAEGNTPARKSYEKLGFHNVGETDLFDHHYICYEIAIQELLNK